MSAIGREDETPAVAGIEVDDRESKRPRRPFTRKRSLRNAIATLLAGSAAWLILATVQSLYKGTGVAKATPPEKPAAVEATSCQRDGPITWSGFGYWWTCRATARVSDGREVKIVVTHSILAPGDVGRTVDFREACFGENNTRCVYGRPTNHLWAFLLELLGIVRAAVAFSFGFLAFVYLLGAIFGKDRANRIIGHSRRHKKP